MWVIKRRMRLLWICLGAAVLNAAGYHLFSRGRDGDFVRLMNRSNGLFRHGDTAGAFAAYQAALTLLRLTC